MAVPFFQNLFEKYSQTWANDHLQIVSPNLESQFESSRQSLNNDHQSTRATNL